MYLGYRQQCSWVKMYLVPYYFICIPTWVFNSLQHTTLDHKDKANWTSQRTEKKHYSLLKITVSKACNFKVPFLPLKQSPATFLLTGQFQYVPQNAADGNASCSITTVHWQ